MKTSIRNDGYCILFSAEGYSATVRFSGNPVVRTKAEANKLCFALAREWRAGKGAAADYYRSQHRSLRRSGFTAIGGRPAVANGRTFILNVAGQPFARIAVTQNLKEVQA